MTKNEDGDIGIWSKIAISIVNALVAAAVPQLPKYKPVAGWEVVFFVAAVLSAATATYFALRDDQKDVALILAVIVTIGTAIAYPVVVSRGGITMPMLYVAVTVYAVMFGAASYSVAYLLRFLIPRLRSLIR